MPVILAGMHGVVAVVYYWYRLASNEDRFSNSLRLVSGLILPFLAVFSIFILYRYKWNIEIPVAVIQLLLLVDLIYLIK